MMKIVNLLDFSIIYIFLIFRFIDFNELKEALDLAGFKVF